MAGKIVGGKEGGELGGMDRAAVSAIFWAERESDSLWGSVSAGEKYQALYRNPSELVVNREEGKKPKQHQANHNLHSVSCLQNGQDDASLPPNSRKEIIKLEKMGENPRSVWEKEGMEQRHLFLVTVEMILSFSMA